MLDAQAAQVAAEEPGGARAIAGLVDMLARCRGEHMDDVALDHYAMRFAQICDHDPSGAGFEHRAEPGSVLVLRPRSEGGDEQSAAADRQAVDMDLIGRGVRAKRRDFLLLGFRARRIDGVDAVGR